MENDLQTIRENLYKIGNEIKTFITKRVTDDVHIYPVGRIGCTVCATNGKELELVIWILNGSGDETHEKSFKSILNSGESVIFLNDKKGEFFTRHIIEDKKNPSNNIFVEPEERNKWGVIIKRQNSITYKIHNRFFWGYGLDSDFKLPIDIQCNVCDDVIMRFNSLDELIYRVSKVLGKSPEDITFESISERSWTRRDPRLRLQPSIDIQQDIAKRDNFFNGNIEIIEGGPGSGKTTVLVDRLKFLTDRKAHKDNFVDSKFSDTLFDDLDKNWLLVTPNTQLIDYVRDNLNNQKNLHVIRGVNTVTMEELQKKLLKDYFCASSDNPEFEYLSMPKSEDFMFFDSIAAKKKFESKIVAYFRETWSVYTDLDISLFCKTTEAKKIADILLKIASVENWDDICSYFRKQHKDILSILNRVKERLDNSINLMADFMSRNIAKYLSKKDFDKYYNMIELLSDWDGYDLQGDYIVRSLRRKLPQLIQAVAIARIRGDEIRLKRFSSELFEIIREPMVSYYDQLTSAPLPADKTSTQYSQAYYTKYIGENALLWEYYGNLKGSGIRTLMESIPKIYKRFRVEEMSEDNGIFNPVVLSLIRQHRNDKVLCGEEVTFLVTIINEFFKSNSSVFADSEHHYYKAYKDNLKYIICVDEATDFSLLEYNLLNTLCHSGKSSMTICGDLMQRLKPHGIKDWRELESVFSADIDIKQLAVSYRQLPNLVEMARALYKDECGCEAPFKSYEKPDKNDPVPEAFVSQSRNDKINWISTILGEIYKDFKKDLPSVAIFVGNETNASELIADIQNSSKHEKNIRLIDCTRVDSLDDPFAKKEKNAVRVFRITEVKGMEFEAVFFYDIDTALKRYVCDMDGIMKRHVYVGISRATSRLYATFNNGHESEHLVNYFKDYGKVTGMEGKDFEDIITGKKSADIEETAKALVWKEGIGIVTTDTFVNMLRDYPVFNNGFKYKGPFAAIVHGGFIKSLIKIGEYDNLKIDALIQQIHDELYVEKQVIKEVLHVIMYALGWIKKRTN